MTETGDKEPTKPNTPDKLIELAQELGYRESPNLSVLRKSLDSIENFAEFVDEYKKYQEEAEKVVNGLEGENFPKGQIGLILVNAQIYYSRGMFSDSSDSVKDALEYAAQLRDDESVRKIMELWLSDSKFTYKRRIPGD